MRYVFENIESKLRELTNSRGERMFKTIELNSGQMMRVKGFENTEKIISFPAVFYKPEEIKHIPRPNNIYVTEMRIRIHVVTNELVHKDPLEIFDLPRLVDKTLLNSKWDTVNLVSLHKGFDVMPETFDNNQIYELNYWIKYWNINSYRYADYVDANDTIVNPSAPVELCLDDEIDDEIGDT